MEPEIEKSEMIYMKKTNVFFVVFLSVLTLGIYIGYWFLSRKKDIIRLGKQNYIPFKWWWVFFVFLVVSFIYQFLGGAFLTDLGLNFFDSLDTICSFFYLGLLYYSTFRLKELLEEEVEEEIFSPVLLVLFHIWYLQYKINRLVDAGGNL
ncbi:hypothetical protein NSQ96_14855 [Caldifermentibacillus hisashii]|uniref:hypothetical protein n=1 Tax=Bacillaceae TaxID=186817 RepID=UPI00203A459C|nr:hypothetical protein [Caldibacillus thermoamylovorans]MCM3055656.1 hypothetical protein [Caldibacillus thermoamylovorans]